MPVPVEEGDFIRLEYYLNCLRYAGPNCLRIHVCFHEAASRQIVVEFLSACQSAATSNLWTYMTALCDALHIALQSINLAEGDRYKKLEESIFSRAAQDCRPPMKHKHPMWLGAGGRDPDCVRARLTDHMDTITSLVMDVLQVLRD